MSKLNILNQQQKVIGQEERDVIHRDGLWHQEINIWFYTPNGEIIFQHRSKDKDMFADKLDATVGGHVEIDSTYDETAIIEAKEETGLDLKIKDLQLIDVVQRKSFDEDSGLQNNSFKAIYTYLYKGPLEDLTPEKNKALGFELWDIDDLLNIGEDDRVKFIPSVFNPGHLKLFRKIDKKTRK